MNTMTAVTYDRIGREGRPLLYSLTETLVFVLIAVALVATAAVPALIRHPHIAEAKTVTSTHIASAGR